MIHTRINNRVEFHKIHITSIYTFQAFIYLDILYFAKESCRLSCFNGINNFTFIYPSTRIQNRYIYNFSSTNGI